MYIFYYLDNFYLFIHFYLIYFTLEKIKKLTVLTRSKLE